jgi:hypothetical protein
MKSVIPVLYQECFLTDFYPLLLMDNQISQAPGGMSFFLQEILSRRPRRGLINFFHTFFNLIYTASSFGNYKCKEEFIDPPPGEAGIN